MSKSGFPGLPDYQAASGSVPRKPLPDWAERSRLGKRKAAVPALARGRGAGTARWLLPRARMAILTGAPSSRSCLSARASPWDCAIWLQEHEETHSVPWDMVSHSPARLRSLTLPDSVNSAKS